ncbi:MAG: lytic transglycosylase domain-containing protein [Deltaproteobacteria bacterium]|nr:lytic transglycosylase domain-containing protein [Deltaproteobacteria bacterium]MBW2085507.1 lytic transglycosylase domain-containing protein [Deltaproteobacteria bacterium]
MNLKRLILLALLAVVFALAVVSLEARHIFRSADSSLASTSKAVAESRRVLRPGPSAPVVVNIVAQKLEQQKSREMDPATYDRYIEKVAQRHGVSPALIKAVIKAESRFDPQAISRKGAIGLMQVMPATAKAPSIRNLFDPHYNIQAGVKYLKKLLVMFDGNETLALAAYNSGPRKVKRYGGVPPFRETRVFVKRVLTYYEIFQDS